MARLRFEFEGPAARPVTTAWVTLANALPIHETFLVDTGADRTALRPSAWRWFDRAPAAAPRAAFGISGATTTRRAGPARLQLETDEGPVVVPLPAVALLRQELPYSLLGRDLFRQTGALLTLDFLGLRGSLEWRSDGPAARLAKGL